MLLCKTMEVTRSGYYAYEKNKLSRGNNTLLIVEIRALHIQNRKAYGSRRLAKALRLKGYQLGRYKTRKLMQEAKIECKQRRRYRYCVAKKPQLPLAENLLNRKFSVDRPNKAWVSDITNVWTEEGWLYLAIVLDLFSRAVVGWACEDHMRESLVCDALMMAITIRQPAPGLLHHSDQGSQYTSQVYRALLEKHGIESSMSRRGTCLDNAVIERFNGSFKTEEVYQKKYMTKQQAKSEIADYIERFYNSERLHSTIGYISPRDYERTRC